MKTPFGLGFAEALVQHCGRSANGYLTSYGSAIGEGLVAAIAKTSSPGSAALKGSGLRLEFVVSGSLRWLV